MKKLMIPLLLIIMLVASVSSFAAETPVNPDPVRMGVGMGMFKSFSTFEEMKAARLEIMKERLDQGLISQEKYDLMIERMENCTGDGEMMQKRTGMGMGLGMGQGMGNGMGKQFGRNK